GDQRLELLLADRGAVAAERQSPASVADDDQLVGVGAAVANGEEEVAWGNVLRRADPEVPLGDANDGDMGARLGPAPRGDRKQGERRESEGPQSHPGCSDRNEAPRLTQMGEAPAALLHA